MEKTKTGHEPAISPGNFKEYGRYLRMLFPKPSDTDIDATVITIVFMLPTVRSRALAMLAVDYMDGLCTRETLCGWKGQLTLRNLKRRNGKED